MTLYTSQSQIVEAQRCPRRRWWSHFALPESCPCTFGEPGPASEACPRCVGTGVISGIEPVRKSVPLLLGGAVHAGLAWLLAHGAGATDQAVEVTKRLYKLELGKAGLDLNPTEEQTYVADEQLALGEALVRLAALRVVPLLLARYDVVWVERDLQAELAPGVVLRGRVDALLREKASGDLFLLNWKTKAKMDDRATEDAQHDDQGLSETWLVEKWLDEEARCGGWSTNPTLPAETSGVLMCWLLKGERRESKPGSGQWQQASPLIRGYRRFDDAGKPEYAWAYYWEDAATGSRRALGRGWEKVDMWAAPGGIARWVGMLDTSEVQPEAGDCLASQWVMPAPYYRQPQDVGDWLWQATVQEDSARLLLEQPESGELSGYPQHRHSCSYPSRCPFYSLCWGAPHIRENPLENGFVRREPYVPAEVTNGAE